MKHAGSYFPDQGSNLHPLQWKRRVLTTGLPGESKLVYFKEEENKTQNSGDRRLFSFLQTGPELQPRFLASEFRAKSIIADRKANMYLNIMKKSIKETKPKLTVYFNFILCFMV